MSLLLLLWPATETRMITSGGLHIPTLLPYQRCRSKGARTLSCSWRFLLCVVLALAAVPSSASTVFDRIRPLSSSGSSLLQRSLPSHRSTRHAGPSEDGIHIVDRRQEKDLLMEKAESQLEEPSEEDILEYLDNRYRQSFDAASLAAQRQHDRHQNYPHRNGIGTASAVIAATGASDSQAAAYAAHAGTKRRHEAAASRASAGAMRRQEPVNMAEEAYWDLWGSDTSDSAAATSRGSRQVLSQRSPMPEEDSSWSVFGDDSQALSSASVDLPTVRPRVPERLEPAPSSSSLDPSSSSNEASWYPFSGTGYSTSALTSSAEPNVSFQSRQEVTELDAECRGPVSMLPETFSSTSDADGESDFTAREAVWMLKHREMIPSQVADKLIDLEGKHDDKFRQVASRFVASVNSSCISPSLCLGIAARILSSDESTCPRGRLLTQLMNQLESSWVHNLLSSDSDSLRPRLTSRDKALTPAQLAVKHWGSGLIVPKAAMQETVLFDSNASIATQVAWGSLDNLVGAILDPGADLPFMTRSFLLAAQRQAESLTGPNTLVILLRTLEEQRQSLTREGLVRDAAFVDHYEPRVTVLERKAQDFDMSNPEKASAWEAMQYDMDILLEQLRRASADHQNSLPGDSGVLAAYWMGRIERVRRQVEDRLSGRDEPRPTVLIWTCSFGGGHWAATKALEQYLPDYYVVVSDPTKDREYYEGDKVGDWIRQYITPKWDETYMFNELILKHRHYKLENTIETLQAWHSWLRGDGTRFSTPCAAPLCDYQQKRFMRRALLRSAPDFMITVYHMDLTPITELAQELGGLPIMHLATDIDAKMWEVWGKRPEYEHLKIGLPFSVPEAMVTIQPLFKNQTFVSGYAVRPAFLRPLHTHEELAVERRKRKIPKNAVVVLVMSGSEGQTVPWPAMLADSTTWEDVPLHIVVVVGGNYEFGTMLERAYKDTEQADGHLILRGTNRLVTLEVAKDPDSAADKRSAYFVPEQELVTLMDIADVLLTKGGGGTTAEAAYRGLPVLFDATDGMLKWEAFTATVFEQHHRGKRLTDNLDVETHIRHVINLGRSRSLVLGNETGHENGELINATARIRAQMDKMREHVLLSRPKIDFPA